MQVRDFGRFLRVRRVNRYAREMAKVRIGDLLLTVGLIDALQLKSALAAQRQYGGRLGDLLVDMGFLDEMMLYRALAKQLGMKLVNIPDLEIGTDVVRALPSSLAMKHDVFPVHKKGRDLFIATSDTNDIAAVDDIQSRLGIPVKTVLAPAREISWAIGHHYQGLREGCPPPKTKAQSPKSAHNASAPGPAASMASRPNAAAPGSFPPTGSQAVPPPNGSPWSAFPTTSSGASTIPGPASSTAVAIDPASLARLDANLRETQNLLNFILDACVRRGVFTQEEFQRKLRSR